MLDIPDYLGSAKVDNKGNIIESNRNPHQWRRVKYSYMDCRRYANTRDITILGTQKIWDTNLISIAFLWTKKKHPELVDIFINHVYEKFWKRELDIENHKVIINIFKKLTIDSMHFTEWSKNNGKKELELIINEAHEKGVFGVPSYYFNNELFWGREHLSIIEARITDDYSKIY